MSTQINLWELQLAKLLEICNERGIVVQFIRGNDDEYFPDKKEIVLNSRRIAEHQFYILLHELGHHKILKTPSLKNKFSSVNTDLMQRSLSKQTLLLEEEVLAWHIGEEIAKEHKMFIDEKKFQYLKSKCLKSHVLFLKKISNK